MRIYYYKSSITIVKRTKKKGFLDVMIFPQGSQIVGMGKERKI